MLTPSGRFETQKKICLSISSFHPFVSVPPLLPASDALRARS
jgi:hypothetical protein